MWSPFILHLQSCDHVCRFREHLNNLSHHVPVHLHNLRRLRFLGTLTTSASFVDVTPGLLFLTLSRYPLVPSWMLLPLSRRKSGDDAGKSPPVEDIGQRSEVTVRPVFFPFSQKVKGLRYSGGIVGCLLFLLLSTLHRGPVILCNG